MLQFCVQEADLAREMLNIFLFFTYTYISIYLFFCIVESFSAIIKVIKMFSDFKTLIIAVESFCVSFSVFDGGVEYADSTSAEGIRHHGEAVSGDP